MLRESFSCRNPEHWGWGRGYRDRNLLKIGQAYMGGGQLQTVAQTCLSLKAQDAEAGWIPSPQGHPAGRSVGARPVQGRQVGSANWIFYFYIKTLCLKFLQRTNSMGFR